MDIFTKNIDMEVDLPVDITDIEKKLAEDGINPLRFAIVKVDNNKLTINVTYDNL